MQIQHLPLAQIEIPSVRVTNYMPPEDAEQFAASVQGMGILQPLLVLQDDGRYYLVDGLNRLLQARDRGDPTVPCVIREGSLQEVLVANLVTGTQHGKPRHSEVRRVIQALEEEYAMDLDALHERTHLSEDYLSKLMWVNRALDEVQQALDAEEIPLGAAVAIARISDAAWQRRMFELYLERRPRLSIFEPLCTEVRENPPPLPGSTIIPTGATVAIPTNEQACDSCDRPTRPRDLRPLMLCPACYGQTWEAVRSAAVSPAP